MRISDWSSDVCSSDLIPHGTAADYAGGSIQRIDIASGAVETLYTEAAGAPLCGPNDIVFDAHGGFWFTDHGKTHPRSRDITGVFYARADGSACREEIGRASCRERVCQYV